MIKKAEAMELLDDYTRWLNDRSLFQMSTSQVNGYLEDKEKREYKLEEDKSLDELKCPNCNSNNLKVLQPNDNLWQCNQCNRLFVD